MGQVLAVVPIQMDVGQPARLEDVAYIRDMGVAVVLPRLGVLHIGTCRLWDGILGLGIRDSNDLLAVLAWARDAIPAIVHSAYDSG